MPCGPLSKPRMTVCGLDRLASTVKSEISDILSILDPGLPRPLALTNTTAEGVLELRFHDVIAPERAAVPPNASHIAQILAFGRQVVKRGSSAHLLIHCQAGHSRSTAAAALCLAQAHPIRSAYEVLGELVRRCPKAWPNLLMLELGDEALGRQGEFISAAGALYRRAIDKDPGLGVHMRRYGRAREVSLAERWR
jgi:predicted protein tyrosine phosphatase